MTTSESVNESNRASDPKESVSCCTTTENQTCCEASAKPECCGTETATPPVRCGCK